MSTCSRLPSACPPRRKRGLPQKGARMRLMTMYWALRIETRSALTTPSRSCRVMRRLRTFLVWRPICSDPSLQLASNSSKGSITSFSPRKVTTLSLKMRSNTQRWMSKLLTIWLIWRRTLWSCSMRTSCSSWMWNSTSSWTRTKSMKTIWLRKREWSAPKASSSQRKMSSSCKWSPTSDRWRCRWMMLSQTTSTTPTEGWAKTSSL